MRRAGMPQDGLRQAALTQAALTHAHRSPPTVNRGVRESDRAMWHLIKGCAAWSRVVPGDILRLRAMCFVSFKSAMLQGFFRPVVIAFGRALLLCLGVERESVCVALGPNLPVAGSPSLTGGVPVVRVGNLFFCGSAGACSMSVRARNAKTCVTSPLLAPPAPVKVRRGYIAGPKIHTG